MKSNIMLLLHLQQIPLLLVMRMIVVIMMMVVMVMISHPFPPACKLNALT